MIRQLKFLFVAHLVYCIVRMMMHSWSHGYDEVFDLRFIQVILSMIGAAILAALDEIHSTLKERSTKLPPTNIPYFQTLDIAPAPETMEGGVIYIKNYARLYRSDGEVWIPL